MSLREGNAQLDLWVQCRRPILSRPSLLIVRNPPDTGMVGMQGIVQALITRPQLDPIPFRKGHIQAVIRPLLVLVRNDEGPVGDGRHIAEHKGQGEQIPDRQWRGLPWGFSI